jgi:hypothetical protein
MNNKGKVVAELTDEKWLWDLALLCDISKTSRSKKLTFDMLGTVRAFEMKLKLFWKEVENVNLCHVSSRDICFLGVDQ